MHASVALAVRNAKLWVYITALNCTPYVYICENQMINGAFKSPLQDTYAVWVGKQFDGGKKESGPVPVPSREKNAAWVL